MSAAVVPDDVLYLIIRLGRDRYAIDAGQVIEVLPVVRLKLLPGAPHGVAGLMNYRNEALPVVDLGMLALGRPTQSFLRTRIVVVRVAEGADNELGLLVPEATETVRYDHSAFVTPAIDTNVNYLGPVLTTPEGVIQRVRVEQLLTPEIRDAVARAAEISA